MSNDMEPILNSSNTRATPFSYGAGHIRPNQAMDPGLVYDLTVDDHLNFLCALKFNATQIESFSESPYKCPTKPINLANFNYPSITIPNFNGLITVARTVKNVGYPSTYRVGVRSPTGLSVVVKPRKLKFRKFGEEKMFSVTVKANKGTAATMNYVFGELVWTDKVHDVRSPIVVKW